VIGEYINELPARNTFTFLDPDGKPLAGARLEVWQAKPVPTDWYGKRYEGAPAIVSALDGAGKATLVRNQFGAVNVVGTDEKGEVEISQHDFTLPTVLLAGNETWGLSKAFLELCDTIARIPIAGSASSLNVACATSIVLYEINRQRAVHAG
jgi:hypothetical protein